jgi:hypothetical protein
MVAPAVRTPSDVPVDVVRIAPAADGSEAIALVNLPLAAGGVRPTRYRLVKAGDGWMAYDEAAGSPWLWQQAARADVEGGGRGAKDGPLAAAVKLASTATDPAALEKAVAPLRGGPLAPVRAAWRHYCEGRLALLSDRLDDAAKAFEQAVSADPTWPMGYDGRKGVAEKKGDKAAAAKAAATIAELVGP